MKSKPIKILIVEDDPFLMKVAGLTLEDSGFIVERAGTGKEAIEKIKNDDFKLVLLDLIMPEMNGFEVLAKLKKDNNKTPVVVFTNLAQEEDKKEALSLGAKDYYIKSDIILDELVRIVNTYVN
ncbi:response regulator [Candidatus Peregrinibacteria bacterium]|nr:response regulator [Candidatus Peregrinibacteria bacterium]